MKLYRFCSLEGKSAEHTLNVLRERQIYFSPYEQLNDPFEYAFSWSDATDVKEKVEFWSRLDPHYKTALSGKGEEQQLKDIEQWERSLARPKTHRGIIPPEQGVFCTSDTWQNLVLWSHYADKHMGVCFEFESDLDARLKGCRKVEYRDTPHEWNLYKGYKPVDILCSKYTDWAYEREYRVFDTKGTYQFAAGALTKLLIGSQVYLDKARMARVGELIALMKSNFKGAEIGVVRRQTWKYALEINKFEGAWVY